MTDLNGISNARLSIVGLFLTGAAAVALLLSPRGAQAQFPQQVITEVNASSPRSVQAADIDGDGDKDALSASWGDNKIAWYENQNGESGADLDSFGPQRVITTDAGGTVAVFAADMDGDGDSDVISASFSGDEIAWYENQVGESGADADGFGSQQIITTNVSAPVSVFAADVDGDGDKDVLSASEEGTFNNPKIAWYENQLEESGADEDGFGDQQVITTNVEDPESVHAADVDGDGDPDVLFADRGSFSILSKIGWHENQVGENGADEDGFGDQQVITTEARFAQSVHAADVNGDGEPDVLSASQGDTDSDSKVAWYENQVGESGADDDGFGDQQIISTEADEAQSVFAADVDEDGDADVFSASRGDAKVAWYENQVGESGADADGFGTQKVITTNADFAQSVAAGDVDGDGDPDALSAAQGDNEIAWYENQVGESGADADGFGPAQFISEGASQAQSAYAADIDGDGDPDAFSASEEDNKIAWYENRVGDSGADSDGFGPQQAITNEALLARSVFAADVDGDGDPDALSGSASEVSWHENQVGENGAESDGFGAQQVITTNVDGVWSVHAADVDGDGDPDVLSTSLESFSTDPKITWHENQVGESGADSDGFGGEQVITTNVDEPRSVHAADLDGDGDPDVLSASDLDDKIAWYENQVGESGADSDGFGDQQIITTDAGSARSVFARDLDGDGDADVLFTSGFEVVWHENQVGENGADSDGFGPRQVITTNVDEPQSVHTADLNGDGKADVLSASAGDDKIAWHENQVGESGADSDGFGDQQIITSDASGAQFVLAKDIDGDEDSDPVSASSEDGKIAWYRNDLASILAKQSAIVDENGEVDFGDTGVDINFSGVASDSGEVTVTKIDGGPTDMPGISEGTVSTYRFTVNRRGELFLSSDTEIQLDVSTLSGVGDASNVTIYERPNEGTGEFTALSTSFDSGNNELVATTGSFGEFVLASDSDENPLPVEMAGFEATTDGEEVQLTWQTASETNNAGFEVQRRVGDRGNGGEGAWVQVGFVDSKVEGGTTTELQSYRFEDEDLPYAADQLQYRLRQVDLDGTAELTDPVTVERTVDELELRKTFPNPAHSQATVRFAVPKRQEITLYLYDVLGRKVRTVSDSEVQGREELRVDLSGLSSGVYFLRLSAEGTVQTQKLTVVR